MVANFLHNWFASVKISMKFKGQATDLKKNPM